MCIRTGLSGVVGSVAGVEAEEDVGDESAWLKKF
jgi:hypothetical protein